VGCCLRSCSRPAVLHGCSDRMYIRVVRKFGVWLCVSFSVCGTVWRLCVCFFVDVSAIGWWGVWFGGLVGVVPGCDSGCELFLRIYWSWRVLLFLWGLWGWGVNDGLVWFFRSRDNFFECWTVACLLHVCAMIWVCFLVVFR